MMGKRLFVLLAVIALFELQFADCLSAMSHDEQSMQCCGSMPCDPSNQSHDCCKSMASPQIQSVLPVSHVTLHPPAMFVADFLSSSQVQEFSDAARAEFEAPEHSPPELYKLHSSL